MVEPQAHYLQNQQQQVAISTELFQSMKALSDELQKEAPEGVFEKIQKYAQLAASTVLALQLSISLPQSH
jgi:hypothetical protein